MQFLQRVWRQGGCKATYGGTEASDIPRFSDLEREYSEPKKIYAELCLENRAMKSLIEKVVASQTKRE
jgi:hypothetical protein